MCGVYRRFIPGNAKIAVALTRYLKDDIPDSFELDDAVILAHSKLKESFSAAPILALPRPQGLYVLEADASAAQLGVRLLQQQPDESLSPIGFWSRQCTAAECNYSPTEREELAIVRGIRIFVRVLDGLPRVRAVRKSYTILEARTAYRMIV
jgi:RNase H-like domain found in reverse transcriptase